MKFGKGKFQKILILFFLFSGLHNISTNLGLICEANETQTTEICSNWMAIGDLSPSLSRSEKLLVCGKENQKSNGPESEWRNIPFQQAKFHLTHFLEERGYHFPTFGQNESKAWVKVGTKSIVTSVEVEGVSNQIDFDKKRKVKGQPLTPELLESLEKWTEAKLQSSGYACPVVTAVANALTGHVTLRVSNARQQNLIAVEQDSVPGLLPGTLDRFHAFQINHPFRHDLMEITRKRIQSRSIVESNHYAYSCRPDGVIAQHMIVPGSPRLFTLGAGVDTEGIIRGKVSWKNTRVGEKGSLVDLTAIGTMRNQTFRSTWNWYFSADLNRTYLSNAIQLVHENQPNYEVFHLLGQFGAATGFDWKNISGTWFIGPNVDFAYTIEGQGAPRSRFLFLQNKLTLMSHDFEFYSADPHDGFRLSLTNDLSHPAIVSDAPVQRLGFDGEVLWNYQEYDPPLWVLGFRWGVNTLLTTDQALISNLLPASYYKFLGGSTNLRGFWLQELPKNQKRGGLTSGFIGIEQRLANTLPYGFEPFVFSDFGAIGMDSFSFDSPLYLSPGLGIRWKSPIGSFRSTIAQGFSGVHADGWNWYFRYGEEF